MPHVFSTLTNDQLFTGWNNAPDGSPRIGRQVAIAGGSGVMNKNFLTPLGVATEVSDDELEFLQSLDAFQQHVKDGYIKVQAKAAAPEKIAVDMAQRDGSAPLAPADYETGGRMDGMTAPTVTGGQG